MSCRIYHVSYDACTDLEPRPGFYIGSGEDDDFPRGPFRTRQEAQDRLDAWDDGLEEAVAALEDRDFEPAARSAA
jgi:hypothetical protein